jgi:ABC-2 type transport system ATP-binding protein
MSVELINTVSGPPEIRPIVAFHEASKWYGNVIGLNKLTLEISAGITGLLGPNGAGKSTLLQLATGQLCPSKGTVEVLGQRVWNNPELNRRIGLCPEQDALYEWMTGNDFVTTCARLAGMKRGQAREAAALALEAVGMTGRKNRVVRGYSKGMRQRTKLAQALVHDPQVLFLDEPMTGTDPVARRDLMDIVHRLAAEGKSVVVSSHVLHEIEALTPNFILLNHGRLLAQGHIRQIRDLMDQHPHRIVLVCDHGRNHDRDNARSLAARLVQFPDVQGIRMQDQPATLTVETRQPDIFYARLPQLAIEGPWNIQEVYSEDDNLEAVFRYLVNS